VDILICVRNNDVFARIIEESLNLFFLIERID